MAEFRYYMTCDTDVQDGYIDSGKWQKKISGTWTDVTGANARIAVGDNVSFTLSRSGSNPVAGLQLSAVISGKRGAGAQKSKNGSPFKGGGGGYLCLLNGPVANNGNEYEIGPFPVNGMEAEENPSRFKKFEFLAVADVTYNGGGIAQFSLDPEMDVRGRP